ncbi:monocarboxylate transporter 4-like isoform X1 [Dreissena polymorpha]|uniref:monocarboxylate transporter 4-like isoform X1 n=1 Tax=Dreissena polymorpha TaxID=45954 RepID=UPI002264E34B|nr:monocarboxylate transporter 4-like isoform X1 [Dreissena polymorpha]
MQALNMLHIPDISWSFFQRTGPLTCAFVNRFGCRAVAFVGTLVATSGFLISTFASSVLWLYVSFWLIAGLGFGLLNMPPYVMIARYFDRRLSLAIGLGSMDSGLGTLIFNPMSKINQKRAFTEEVQRNYTGQKRWFSIAPLRNPGFVILIVSNLLIELAQNVPFAYLPYMMVDKGFPKQDTVTVIFFISLLSTIARAVIGLIADRKWFSRARLCSLVLVINGVLITMAPFCASRTAFLTFGILFGLSAGSASSLHCPLVPNLFGVAQIADFSGINMFFSAVAAFTGLPAAGGETHVLV